MSLASALIIELNEVIQWDAAVAPGSSGQLTVVDPAAALDVQDYLARDRELLYRDLQVASATVKVSLGLSTIWNADVPRPNLQGAVDSSLAYVPGDVGNVDSQVVHVKYASVPYDASSADRDLAGRDLLVYETLARACSVFEEPPFEPFDSAGTEIPSTVVFSLGEGTRHEDDVNTALPLGRDVFKKPDQRLAIRDNDNAAYVSRLVQVLQNPFEFATRLYVRVNVVNPREPDVYVFSRPPFKAGTTYVSGKEVFVSGQWYRANTTTTSSPLTSTDWSAVDAPRYRTWVTEPALEGRNRIVYDTTLKTLQWFRESNDLVHVPQLYALEIPGIFADQRLQTLVQAPQKQDSQYWRLRAGRIVFDGTESENLDTIYDTRTASGGVAQDDAASLTVPDSVTFQFDGTIDAGTRTRASFLVEPDPQVDITGESNVYGLSGTLGGVTFDGTYAPTSAPPAAGAPVRWQLPLPEGAWALNIEYTNLEGTVDGFGVEVKLNPGGPSTSASRVVLADTVPLSFMDDAGDPLPNGTLVTSQDINVDATGALQSIDITWTYGVGLFHIRRLSFRTDDEKISRYAMTASLLDADGNLLHAASGTSTLDVDGQRYVYDLMPFEFLPTAGASSPKVKVQWSEGDRLPLRFIEASLEVFHPVTPTPDTGGFAGWRQDCLDRAEASARSAYDRVVRALESQTDSTGASLLPELPVDGQWTLVSTESWMALVEVYEQRIRQIDDVPSGRILDMRQYLVSGDDVVYNGGTYAPGETFYGTRTTSEYTAGTDALVTQLGAFRLSRPGDVGQPALVPLGVYFDADYGTIAAANDTPGLVPVVASLEPWMVEAGMYVAQEEFWQPDTF